MAFINEIISETEKCLINYPVSTRRDGSKPTLWQWTIDRERRAYLIHTDVIGGGYEGTIPTYEYALNLEASWVSFSGIFSIQGNEKVGRNINWNIRSIEFPPALVHRKLEVIGLINEALRTEGRLYDNSHIINFNVQFPAYAYVVEKPL
jgi:hypothetical protein